MKSLGQWRLDIERAYVPYGEYISDWLIDLGRDYAPEDILYMIDGQIEFDEFTQLHFAITGLE